MPRFKSLRRFWFILPIVTLWGGSHSSALAQSIVPADRTQVNHQGNRFEITGGQRSRDGANLFHSFDRFGLTREEIANFQSNPALQNILVRVMGGEASLIDGLLQMSGGRSNLFLMNPAGILLGSQARLDLPAAFTATTASGIGFEGGWFNAIGDNNFEALVGQPTSFAFALSQPGAIANFGNLNVADGQSINLLGGTVLNQGQLNAPNGQIILAAVAGSSRVRLSRAGSPLSIEVVPLEGGVTPLSLPALLTGGNLGQAALTIAPDGTAQITGTAIASGSLNAGTVAVLGDRVMLSSAVISTSGHHGGTVLIGGDTRGQGTVPRAVTTIVSADSTIHADALENGNGGRVVIWSDQSTNFRGTITARGGAIGGNGGSVEVSSREQLIFNGLVDTLASRGESGSLLLDPRNVTIGEIVPLIVLAEDSFIDFGTLINQRGKVTVEATNDITLQAGLTFDFSPSGSTDDISFAADSDRDGSGAFIMGAGSQILTDGRRLDISAASINARDITTSGTRLGSTPSGNLSLTASSGDLQVGNINTSANSLGGANAGNVTIRNEANTGRVIVSSIDTSSDQERGGNVTILGDLVQITDTVPATPWSINAQGGRRGSNSGTIDITHRGGANNISFLIADSETTRTGNGTIGGIQSGNQTIDASSPVSQRFFAVAPNGGTDNPTSNVRITSVNTAPTLVINPDTQTIAINGTTAVTVTIPAKLDTSDRNGDTVSLIITDLAPGARLTRNGVALANGSQVVRGESLEYSASTATRSNVAFRIAAADLNENALFLSQSNATYQVLISEAPAETPPIIPPITPPITSPITPVVPPEVFPPVPTTIPEITPEDSPIPIGLSPETPLSPEPEAILGNDLTVLEEGASQDFTSYFGLENTEIKSPNQARDIALSIEQSTGAKPALVYLNFVPAGTGIFTETKPGDNDPLELTIVSANGIIRQRVPGVTRSQFNAVAQTFRSKVTDPRLSQTRTYLASAQQLYQWTIAPIEAQLTEQKITNLVFIPDAGLRAIPYAALHDGKQFLVEKYSIGLMPSLSLTDTSYTNIHNSQVLAIGVSESTQGSSPLPAVPTELSTLMQLWRRRGTSFLNNNATLENLKQTRQANPYGIIHMATHANFIAGATDKSYIQLWNERLQIDQIRQLGWNDPPVEMLVLSACRTALGDIQSELGFAGLAVQAGVKTVVASLWYVSDSATTALMAKFYEQLNSAPIKADALRQAQIAMAQGKVYIANGHLQGVTGMDSIALPLGIDSAQEFSHPYYWASFTMVGNPW
jgi:filamentous hemagglutinin family protein